MIFVCHPKILPKHCLQFLLGVKMASNKEHYGMLWYFLEWSIGNPTRRIRLGFIIIIIIITIVIIIMVYWNSNNNWFLYAKTRNYLNKYSIMENTNLK